MNHLAQVKFGLSEKHTIFEKNLPHGFDKSADLLSKRQNHEEDFFKLCVLLKKSALYHQIFPPSGIPDMHIGLDGVGTEKLTLNKEVTYTIVSRFPVK